MQRQLSLLFKLIIITILILTVGRYFANLWFDDKELADRMIKMTFIVAYIIVPIRHFRLKKNSKR